MMIRLIFLLYFVTKIFGEDPPPSIIGGNEATPHAYPWQVSLRVNGQHSCGGSLINKQWILTAAHCCFYEKKDKIMQAYEPSDFNILLGAHYAIDTFKNNQNETKEIPVEEIHVHSMYNEYGDMHDIALMKMERSVEPTKSIKPIILPQWNNQLKEGTKVTVTGWGVMKQYLTFSESDTYDYRGGCSIRGAQLLPNMIYDVPCGVWELNEFYDKRGVLHRHVTLSPDALQKVDTHISNYKKCWEKNSKAKHPEGSIICAAEKLGGKDSCQGDSGGPLVAKKEDKWVQYGIVSYGDGCAKPNTPAVYTRISFYIGWINEKTM